MFIKRKTRVGKTYAYRMLLSFQTSVTYKKNFQHQVFLTTVFVVKQLLPDITRFFEEHYPMGLSYRKQSIDLLYKQVCFFI